MSTLQKPQNALFAKQPIRDVSAEKADQIRRCLAAERQCVWAEASRRARKLRAPSRISQVEQKIDGLVASLVNPAATSATTNTTPTPVEVNRTFVLGGDFAPQTNGRKTPVAPGNWLPFPTSFEQHPETSRQQSEQVNEGEDTTDRHYIEQIRSIHSFDDREDREHHADGLFKPSKRREDPIEDPLINDLLETGEADTLLDEYRTMSCSFPFVPLASNISARQLYQETPMLFLAMTTAASRKEHQRQLALDAIYRRELANRTIISPRKNLGLVQSVLVYLSWYHFVFSHKTQQIFMLHHLVVGLALDIGLHRDFQPTLSFNRQKPQQVDPGERRKRQRAFLGCYYLASMVSSALQKPNLLKYNSDMTDWSQELRTHKEYKTDEMVAHLISLRHLEDQIQDTLFTGTAAEASLADTRVIMQLRFLETQLDAWKRGCEEVESQRIYALSHSFIDMQLHTVALRPRPQSAQPSTTDGTHIKTLISALEAAKRFFDSLLSYPASQYHLISFSEWIRLPATMMVVAKLCIPSSAHAAAGWDVKAAQHLVHLEICLEALCYRFQNQSTYDKVKQPHPDFWWVMQVVTDLTRGWYIRKTNPQTQSTSETPTPYDHAGNNHSGPCHAALPTPPDWCAQSQPTEFAHIDFSNVETVIEANEEIGDPFAFMKTADFDMEQLFDIGLWGDEAYTSMGFGGGMLC